MQNYTNPVIPCETDGHTADPYVIYHDGFYYHCYCRHDGVYISRSACLSGIGSGEEFRVFEAPSSGNGSEWYAPELHFIDGAWYIYAAPLIDEKSGLHCMVVLQNKSDSPIGDYVSLGMVQGLENTWCIDGTVMEHCGEYWFIWTTCAQMYMARMQSPWAISGSAVALTHPEYPFETKQGIVNEGPAVLKKNNKIHIVYSANDSKTDDYCLGMLTYSGGNIADISNWTKSKKAVFEKADGIYGPGHCSFTKVDGKDYIVYHANLESGSGWSGRSVWIQPFDWDSDDMPVFGKPQR